MAVGTIGPFRQEVEKSRRRIDSHVIHPVTLDAAAQLGWVTLTKGGTCFVPTRVPTLLRSAWVVYSGLEIIRVYLFPSVCNFKL